METQNSTNKERSILVVEDENESLQLLSAVLVAKYPDISIYSALNGKIGFELFITHLPDLVITDINMPEINGNQLAEKISKIRTDVKLIAITGKSCNIDLENSGSYFEHYIEKPVLFKKLFTLIDQCIG